MPGFSSESPNSQVHYNAEEKRMERYEPNSQPSLPSSDLAQDIEIISISSDDEDGHKNVKKRVRPTAGKSFKTYNELRMDSQLPPVIDLTDSPNRPNLGAYFACFNLSYEEQIQICRGYANYLSRAAGFAPRKRK